MRIAALSALVLLVAPLAAEARPLLAPLALTSDDYGESYSFIADLDDGSYILLQLGISNIGPGSGHGICRGLLVSPSGAVWSDNEIVDSDEWRHESRGASERLAVGPCALTAGPEGTTIAVNLDDNRLSLTFAQRPKPERAPGARLAIAGHQHVQESWIAAAPVRASIQLEDQKPQSVTGSGYGDHAASDVNPDLIAARWTRFRALRASPPVLLQGRLAPDGSQGPNWVRRGDRFASLGAVEVVRSGPKKTPTFRVQTGTITITSDRFLYRYDPIDELGVLGTLVSPFVGAPVSYTVRATLHDGDRKIAGLLEIEVAKE